MSEINPDLLTHEDFLKLRGALPEAFFCCPDCQLDTFVVITRHHRSKYIAEFQCVNPGCSRSTTGKKWYKCRVCTHKNATFPFASKHNQNSDVHKLHVSLFERSKNKAYVAQEEFYANSSTQNYERISATSSFAGDLDDGIHDFFVGHDNEDFGADESSDLSPDDEVETVPKSVPLTVKEWKKELIKNSRSVPCDNLSVYFPATDENTPIPGHVWQPWNRQYYQSNSVHLGDGPRLLVAKAVVHNHDPSIVNMVSPKNALWCLLLAKLADELTQRQQRMLIALFDHIQRCHLEESRQLESGNLPRYLSLPIPNTHKQLRNEFTGGRNSILEIIPRPIPIRLLENGFVYVPLRSIIQYHLANGQSMDPLLDLQYSEHSKDHAMHGSSPRGKYLLSLCSDKNGNLKPERNHGISTDRFPVEVTIWSDGFDPNTNKRNRGSAHILLVSIGTPEDDYHSGCNTYPVSIGPANGDISVITRLLVDELKSLFSECSEKNVFFDSASRKEVCVFLRVYCFLQDRPERCHWLTLAHGNGTFAGRFGYTADLSQRKVLEQLPSCKECVKLNTRNPTGKRICNQCSDWNFSELFFKVPENYPQVFKGAGTEHERAPMDPTLSHPSSTIKYLPCQRILVKELKTACVSAFEMVRLGIWKKKEGRAYLETHCISSDFCAAIMDTAEKIHRSGISEPMPELPAAWDIPGVDICDHIDVPMHLCFLGITKAMFSELVRDWLKSKRAAGNFVKESVTILENIKQHHLSWCKVEPRFGGYVSENWIAYCRVSKNVHQLLSYLVCDDIQYEDPKDTEMSDYTWKQKKEWLLARQIPGISKQSRKSEIEIKFQEFLDLPEGEVLPGIVRPVVSQASKETVEHMVICWHVCISRIMSLKHNTDRREVEEIRRHIKLFLSAVDDFDCSRRNLAKMEREKKERMEKDKLKREGKPPKRRKKEEPVITPVYRRKPNFLGLLNVPDTIMRFGPIRTLTELDEKGEGKIKHIKCLIQQGLNGNWAYNAMLAYYKEQSTRLALKDCVSNVAGDSPCGEEQLIEVAKEYIAFTKHTTEVDDDLEDRTTEEKVTEKLLGKGYSHFETISRALVSQKGSNPITGTVFEDRFFLSIKKTRMSSQSLFEIRPKEWKRRMCGADYFWWEIVDSALSEGFIVETKSRESFLLLPDMDTIDVDDHRAWRRSRAFYLVTSDWREVVKSSTFEEGFSLQLPMIPGVFYEKG